MTQLMNGLREEAGQTMAEYAVVMTVITIAVVASLALLSAKIQSLITTITPLI